MTLEEQQKIIWVNDTVKLLAPYIVDLHGIGITSKPFRIRLTKGMNGRVLGFVADKKHAEVAFKVDINRDSHYESSLTRSFEVGVTVPIDELEGVIGSTAPINIPAFASYDEDSEVFVQNENVQKFEG